jgi:hypothetical protein
MLDGLLFKFSADAGLQTQVGECIHRLTAAQNSGKGVDKKYVTFKRLTDANPLKVGGTRTTVTDRVEFICHGKSLDAALDVYAALRAIIVGQHTGTWGSAPAYTIQSAHWDGDSYDERHDATNREYVVSIELIITWTRS